MSISNLFTLIALAIIIGACSRKVVVTGEARQIDPTDLDRVNIFKKSGENVRYLMSIKEEGKKHSYFRLRVKPTDSILFTSLEYVTQTYLAADLIKKNHKIQIVLEREDCNEQETEKCGDTIYDLFAFVGKKISIEFAKEKKNCFYFNFKFDAAYKVEQKLYGNYDRDTIKFTAFKHSGKLHFSEFQNALIYILNPCGKYYAAKVLFVDVYLTENNKWASPYQYLEDLHPDPAFKIPPEKIKFKKPVKYNIKGIPKDKVEKFYPKPYFQIKNNFAYAVYGNYAEDLVELKRRTFFKSIAK